MDVIQAFFFFFEASLSEYRSSICSYTRTKVHHTLTPLHTYTDLHLHTKNKIASFVILAEPARFCRRRACRTDHCGVTRERRHETSPTTVSCTRKLTDPTPPPEHTTAKKKEARSTLFHERDADSLIRAPPGNHTSCCHRPGREPHHEDRRQQDEEQGAQSKVQLPAPKNSSTEDAARSERGRCISGGDKGRESPTQPSTNEGSHADKAAMAVLQEETVAAHKSSHPDSKGRKQTSRTPQQELHLRHR